MARVKLSEFRAKKLLFAKLGRQYSGIAIDLQDSNYLKKIAKLSDKKLYVCKVDQAVKKRGKSGLVKIKRDKGQLAADLRGFGRRGFRYALVEPFVEHLARQECYLAMLRTAAGVELSYSPQGGVEVESNTGSLKRSLLKTGKYNPAQNKTGLDDNIAQVLFDLFQECHMTLLEINPFIMAGQKFLPLDAAVEVDSAAEFFVNTAWNQTDIRQSSRQESPAESNVAKLNTKSPASLSLRVLNPNGSIFLLLSGGGASVVVADELGQLKRHRQIANYGEYSGNPNTQETYLYTKEILGLMLKSKAPKKVLVIAGGVANFTDVAKTFAGIIKAMDEMSAAIAKQKVRVFVRRGGPNQQQGLKSMAEFLQRLGLENSVYGPETSLAAVIKQVARAAA